MKNNRTAVAALLIAGFALTSTTASFAADTIATKAERVAARTAFQAQMNTFKAAAEARHTAADAAHATIDAARATLSRRGAEVWTARIFCLDDYGSDYSDLPRAKIDGEITDDGRCGHTYRHGGSRHDDGYAKIHLRHS